MSEEDLEGNGPKHSWSRKMFNWVSMGSSTASMDHLEEANCGPIPTITLTEGTPQKPYTSSMLQQSSGSAGTSRAEILLNSNETSSISDSEEPQLVSITRLQDRSGMGSLIHKIRERFRKEGEGATRFWMPDSNSRECHDCSFKFTTMRRRHHCRICGQIFCYACCSKKIDGDRIGWKMGGRVRCCNYCHEVLNGYLTREKEKTAKLTPEPSSKRSVQPIPDVFRDLFYTPEAGVRTPRKSLDETSLYNVISPMSCSVPIFTPFKHKNSLSMRGESYSATPPTFFSPQEEETNNSQEQLQQSKESDGNDDVSQEPAWVKEIEQKENFFEQMTTAEFCEGEKPEMFFHPSYSRETVCNTESSQDDNVFRDDVVSCSRNRTSSSSCSLRDGFSNIRLNQELTRGESGKAIGGSFKENYDERFGIPMANSYELMYEKLAQQMLLHDNLSESWIPFLREITKRVASTVKSSSDMNEDMDIRRHIKIKSVTGGQKSDCRIFDAIVFSKHVSHRKMRHEIRNPRILLLSCPLVYQQRSHQKYINLELLQMQEMNYLENLVEKICSYGPNLVIVNKVVSITAQELLLKKKITLICNVKESTLSRIARMTGGEIVASLDAQVSCPVLGECEQFFVQSYSLNKTLMFLNGCPPSLGCTILLRGAVSKQELKCLKCICYFLIYCDYNWLCEKSLLEESMACVGDETLRYFNDQYTSQLSSKERTNSCISNASLKVEQKKCLSSSADPLNIHFSNEIGSSNTLINKDSETETLYRNKMRSFLKDLVLITSPFVDYELPYLLQQDREQADISAFFNLQSLFELPHFRKFVNADELTLRVDERVFANEQTEDELARDQPHSFLTMDLRNGVTCEAVQEQLALYRACGRASAKAPCRKKSAKLDESINRYDPFDVRYHQAFPVLYCNYTHGQSALPFCTSPFIMLMEFYVQRDMTLGAYLKKYCFSSATRCACKASNIDHVSKFSHASGAISVRLLSLEESIATPQLEDIMAWSWCQICRRNSMNRVMSENALNISFAKFLQLKMLGKGYMRWNEENAACSQHSLFHDHYQYFAYKDMIAIFIYQPVALKEICLPPRIVALPCAGPSLSWLNSELQRLHRIAYESMSLVVDHIFFYQNECRTGKWAMKLDEFLEIEQANRAQLKEKIDLVQTLLSDCTTNEHHLRIEDSLKILSQMIAISVQDWNERFQEFETQRKREDRGRKAFSFQHSVPEENTSSLNNASRLTQDLNMSQEETSHLPILGKPLSTSCKNNEENLVNIKEKNNQNLLDKLKKEKNNDQMDQKISTLVSHEISSVEEIKPKNEKFNINTVSVSVTPGVKAALGRHVLASSGSESLFEVIGTPQLDSELKKTMEETENTLALAEIPTQQSQGSQLLRDLSIKPAVKSLFSLLSGNSNLIIPTPFPPDKHLLLPMRERIPVVVQDDDLGSIIAYAVTSSEYDKKLNDLQSGNITDEESGEKPQSEHINLQFNDAACTYYCCIYYAQAFRHLRSKVLNVVGDQSNASTFNEACAIEIEEAYVRSIAQTIPWTAKGGKSKASFCKTQDDRFVIKVVFKNDLHLFTKMASTYFEYMHSAQDECKPTVLAKLVGVYEVSCKNNVTGTAFKKHLLVMENVFWRRRISVKFDLKGSEKNRLANRKQADEVLLDENLCRMMRDQPLYVRAHSKALLQAAIQRDSAFLCHQNVIDYSLLVGLDEQRGEIVLGIIDYIQTYTNLKKLETVIKSVGKVLPTVVDPISYMERFCAKMDQYFQCLPDQWHDFPVYPLKHPICQQ